MKKYLKLTCLFITTIFVLNLCSACEFRNLKDTLRMRDGNGIWDCWYLSQEKNECAIGDWSYEYKQTHEYKNYVFVPSHINGTPVVQYGYTLSMWLASIYPQFNDEKIFMPYTMKKINRAPTYPIHFMVCGNKLETIYTGRYYVASLYYENYIERNPAEINIFKANVVYDINYINEEYKYCSVDNYEYGNLIEIIPPNPEREGYTFAGWFKEAECINEWDFEKDTLPEFKLDENDNVIFQETALYAKWVQN